MAENIAGRTLSETWVRACRYVYDHGCAALNVGLVVAPEAEEDLNIRRILDGELNKLHSGHYSWVRKVADTILPIALYNPLPTDTPGEARHHFYRMQTLKREFLARDRRLRPTYIDRFVSWPIGSRKKPAPLNQLEENVIRPLLRAKENQNCMELSTLPIEEPLNLRVHEPSRDTRSRGGPCLSHISFTLMDKALHMTAMYRNHFYVTKAYGNLVGLRDLQRFVCQETNFKMGELLCVSSHADLLECRTFTKPYILNLIEACESTIAAGYPHPLRVAA